MSKVNYHAISKERKLYDRAKSRAARKAIPFDIDVDDVVIPAVCPVLGTPMDTPSLDRHIPELGYIRGNIVVMSNRANVLKNNGTLDEFERLVTYLKGSEL